MAAATIIRRSRSLRWTLAPLLAARRQVLRQRQRKFEAIFNSIFQPVEDAQIVVCLPDYAGSFAVDFRSDLFKEMARSHAYEPELAALAKRYIHPEKDAVDIGANLGLFTVLAARSISPSRRVLAVDPTPGAIRLLKDNIQRNHVADKVVLFEGALSNVRESSEITLIPGMEEYATLGKMIHPATAGHRKKKICVECETIDNLVNAHNLRPGFIKIDTEGAEFSILKGGRSVLKRHRPVILMELSDAMLKVTSQCTSRAVEAWLVSNGYRVFDTGSRKAGLKHPFHGNIIALPEETGSDRL